MKRKQEGKENKRNHANFFKYVQPQQNSLVQQSKVHSRSLVELDNSTARYQKSARVNNNKENHHNSICGSIEHAQNQTIKSQSLKKFLSIFGGPANITQNSCAKNLTIEEKQSQKNSGRQVFTCNIKNMNVNVTSRKERDQRQSGSLSTHRHQKSEAGLGQMMTANRGKDENKEIIEDLRKKCSQGQQRQKRLKKDVQKLQIDNSALRKELKDGQKERSELMSKAVERQSNLQRKIDNLEKIQASRQKCREHELIIQSLKKVINEQLKKIIELEKLKIQREQIQKLQDRINLNITMMNDQQALQKLKFIETGNLLKMKRKQTKTIKIEDESFSENSIDSRANQQELYSETIQEVPESEERDSCSRRQSVDGDSILDEVDRYLTQWRSRY